MKRALIASGITRISDDSEHALVRAPRVDSDEVSHLYTAPPGNIAANNVIDVAGVNVPPRVRFIWIFYIGKGGLRNVVAREGIIWALKDRAIAFVNQITDNFLVSAIEVVRIQEDVERLLARRTVGIRSTIYVDIHAARQYFERWVLFPVLRVGAGSNAYSENPGDGKKRTRVHNHHPISLVVLVLPVDRNPRLSRLDSVLCRLRPRSAKIKHCHASYLTQLRAAVCGRAGRVG